MGVSSSSVLMVENPGDRLTADSGAIGRAYVSWDAAKRRCLLSSDPAYGYYGGRGIQFCKRWLHFDNFLNDMGPRPIGKTLDRIDVNGHYEPVNCRWATPTEQQRNRRDAVKIIFDGREQHIQEWSEKTGIPVGTLLSRIRKGRNSKDVLSIEKFKLGRPRSDMSHLIGCNFSSLTVLDVIIPEGTPRNLYPHQRLVCECVCGKIKDYDVNEIVRGSTKSCGCRGKGLGPVENIEIGEVFGEWTVVQTYDGFKSNNKDGRFCLCRCSCGKEKKISIYSLRNGSSTNCGHVGVKHKSSQRGSEHFKEYRVWDGMKSACYNPKNKTFLKRKEEGVKVCDSWRESFADFLQDMGSRPDGCILIRRDKTKDFGPDNCFWGTRSGQVLTKLQP